MLLKQIQSAVAGAALLALTGISLAAPVGPDAQGMQKVIHNDGTIVSGRYIAPVNEKVEGPVSVYNLFSLDTQTCGILDFQAGMTGVICTNCQQNTAVLKGCNIPRSQSGWHL